MSISTEEPDPSFAGLHGEPGFFIVERKVGQNGDLIVQNLQCADGVQRLIMIFINRNAIRPNFPHEPLIAFPAPKPLGQLRDRFFHRDENGPRLFVNQVEFLCNRFEWEEKRILSAFFEAVYNVFLIQPVPRIFV